MAANVATKMHVLQLPSHTALATIIGAGDHIKCHEAMVSCEVLDNLKKVPPPQNSEGSLIRAA